MTETEKNQCVSKLNNDSNFSTNQVMNAVGHSDEAVTMTSFDGNSTKHQTCN